MRARMMALVLCAVGCGKPAATPGPSGPGTGGGAPPVVPAELAVPEADKLVLAADAKGVQIYECAPGDGGALAWKLHAPRAELVADGGAAAGSHYGGVDKGLPAGPYWEAPDGSRVHGAKPVSVPNPGSIPLLRLEAADTSGTGVFAKVVFIHRLATTGGVAPAGACEAGKQTEVPYTAKYYFYAAP